MTLYEAVLQITGFFFQTCPIAFLLFVPFSDGELKYPRKKLYFMSLIAEGLFSVGIAVIQAALTKDFPMLLEFGNGYMLVFIAAVTAAFFGTVKAGKVKKVLVMIVCVHYAAILFTVNIALSFAIGSISGNNGYCYDLNSTLSNLILTLITMPFIYIFLDSVVRRSLELMEDKTVKRGCIYFSVALLAYCVFVFINDMTFERMGMKQAGVTVSHITFIIAELVLYYMFFIEARLAGRNSQLEQQINIFNEQYRSISSNIENYRRMRHDMRHHINVIGSFNSQKNYDAITEYLEAYTKSFSELGEMKLCGYTPIDNALSYYISDAENRGIEVKTAFSELSGDMGFDMTDITVLIGNLMENAIEACELVEEGRRKYINIGIRQTDVSLLIQTDNSCLNRAQGDGGFTDGEEYISTKPSEGHGCGIRSIRLAAEKYDGRASFKNENGVFTVRVVLNIPNPA